MKRNTVTAVVILGIVAIVAIVLVADRREAARSGGDGVAFTGKMIDGADFDLAAYLGKPVVINFFASWCGPCNAEAADLAAFAKENPDVVFVGVDTFDDPPDDARAFVQRYGIEYPVVIDEGSSIANDWGVDGIPTTVFLDSGGAERDRIVGAADSAAFEDALKSVR